MASGRLGAQDLAAATNTLLYTVGASILATVNVSICNRNTDPVAIRLAHVDGNLGDLADEDYLEYDFIVPANDSIERTGIVMAATHSLVVYSDTANVSASCHGFEESV